MGINYPRKGRVHINSLKAIALLTAAIITTNRRNRKYFKCSEIYFDRYASRIFSYKSTAVKSKPCPYMGVCVLVIIKNHRVWPLFYFIILIYLFILFICLFIYSFIYFILFYLYYYYYYHYYYYHHHFIYLFIHLIFICYFILSFILFYFIWSGAHSAHKTYFCKSYHNFKTVLVDKYYMTFMVSLTLQSI